MNKSIEQTLVDVKLAELHTKPIDKWTNDEWHFFTVNKDRVLELVKYGYLEDFLPHINITC